MQNEPQKLFIAYNTLTGGIWCRDKFVTKGQAKMDATYQNDVDKSSDWQVAKITHISPIDKDNEKWEITGIEQFNFTDFDDFPWVSNFMAGVKAVENKEQDIRGASILLEPHCLPNVDFDKLPYLVVEKPKIGFYVYNTQHTTFTSVIEKDINGEPLHFDSFDEADDYISKKINSKPYKPTVGELIPHLFVIYNTETKKIAHFDCDIKITRIKWDTNALKHLKQLVNDGLTASEIAIRLGIPKNAVVGKINRLGLKSQSKKDPTNKSDTDLLSEKDRPLRVSKECDICHGIFSNKKAAEHAAKELNILTEQSDIWRVARLKQVELVEE